MTKSQVIFAVGRGQYSFDSLYVRAVEGKSDIKILPGAPDCIEGLTDLRGELVPVIDLNRKFNTGVPSPADCATIFVNTSGGCLGCVVDKVIEIGAITEDLEIELPYLIRAESTEYIAEIVSHKGNLVTAINQDKILSNDERNALDKVMNKAKEKAEKDAEKKAIKEAEKQAAKEAKEAEKQAAKEAKEAEKQAAKEAKEAEKQAAKEAKEAEKQAAKAAKEGEKKAARGTKESVKIADKQA